MVRPAAAAVVGGPMRGRSVRVYVRRSKADRLDEFAKGASSSKSINASTCPGSGLGSPSRMTSAAAMGHTNSRDAGRNVKT